MKKGDKIRAVREAEISKEGTDRFNFGKRLSALLVDRKFLETEDEYGDLPETPREAEVQRESLARCMKAAKTIEETSKAILWALDDMDDISLLYLSSRCSRIRPDNALSSEEYHMAQALKPLIDRILFIRTSIA